MLVMTHLVLAVAAPALCYIGLGRGPPCWVCSQGGGFGVFRAGGFVQTTLEQLPEHYVGGTGSNFLFRLHCFAMKTLLAYVGMLVAAILPVSLSATQWMHVPCTVAA